MVARNPAQLDALGVCVHVGTPCLLWGDPGIGKTSAIYQLAESLKLHLEVVIAAIREPTDFSGLPFLTRSLLIQNRPLVAKAMAAKLGIDVNEVDGSLEELVSLFGTPVFTDGAVAFAPPAWAKNLVRAGRGLLFLDEISTARPAVQTALLRVVFERVVGDLALPKDTVVVAAANFPDQIAGGWDLTPPLANRFVHLEWTLNARAWCEGFIYGWPSPTLPELPQTWRDAIPDTRRLTAAFIHHKPDALHALPASESERGRAWASPRTWDMATTLLTAARQGGLSEEVQMLLVKGCVGQGGSHEFFEYLEDLDLPDPEALLDNPYGPAIPDRDDRLFAALGSVIYAVATNRTAARWNAAWQVLKRAADERSLDVAVSHAYRLAELRPTGAPVPKEIHPLLKALREAGVL